MTAIRIHYAKCWPCTFAERKRDHPKTPHTWMDAEDVEAAKLSMPTSPEEWAFLATDYPCNCACMGRPSVVTL